jgi:hypothetical protein
MKEGWQRIHEAPEVHFTWTHGRPAVPHVAAAPWGRCHGTHVRSKPRLRTGTKTGRCAFLGVVHHAPRSPLMT